jgi:hypothetical protein
MKTRIRSKKLLATVIALATLGAAWAVWGARSAKAIAVIGGTTGMFTVTQGEAVRFHIVNTSDEVAIIDDGDVVGSDGNKLMEASMSRIGPGEATSFEFMPLLAEGERLALRIEVRVEGNSVKTGLVIPTCEVFDTATGKTNFLIGQDFIIDDGK